MSNRIISHTVSFRCGSQCRVFDNFLTVEDSIHLHILAGFFNRTKGFVSSRTARYSRVRVSPIKIESAWYKLRLSCSVPRRKDRRPVNAPTNDGIILFVLPSAHRSHGAKVSDGFKALTNWSPETSSGALRVCTRKKCGVNQNHTTVCAHMAEHYWRARQQRIRR